MSADVTQRLRELVWPSVDASEFECAGCGLGFELDRQQCPDCGGFEIRRA